MPWALLLEYCSLALSDLLSSNLDAVGYSKMRHSIQDRALEQQFFELVVNLASLRPVTEDRHEAEDLCLRQAPAMVIAPAVPMLAPDFSDAT